MKRVTVKDLARELNVSLGTINKALNNKSGLSDETRERILETSARMGYKVNRVAQSLARNPITIGIIMPETWTEYYDYFKKGINLELEKLSDFNLNGKYYTVPNLYSGKESIDILKKCKYDGINAVILCPLFNTDYIECINELESKGIPVVILGSDIEDTNRLCSVRVDAFMSGRLAAEYIGWINEEGKSVAILIGNKDLRDHKDKVEGFIAEAKNYPYRVSGVFETHDDPELAYFLTGKLIKDITDLGCIYVATGNSAAVCRYFCENNINNIRIIATDIFKEIIKYVKENVIQGVIYQDQITQGSTAVKVIYDKLVKNNAIERTIFIPPQIVLRNNIDGYYQYLEK